MKRLLIFMIILCVGFSVYATEEHDHDHAHDHEVVENLDIKATGSWYPDESIPAMRKTISLSFEVSDFIEEEVEEVMTESVNKEAEESVTVVNNPFEYELNNLRTECLQLKQLRTNLIRYNKAGQRWVIPMGALKASKEGVISFSHERVASYIGEDTDHAYQIFPWTKDCPIIVMAQDTNTVLVTSWEDCSNTFVSVIKDDVKSNLNYFYWDKKSGSDNVVILIGYVLKEDETMVVSHNDEKIFIKRY